MGVSFSPLTQCVFNWQKCMWETDPWHYTPAARIDWVGVVMLWATSLERGVPLR